MSNYDRPHSYDRNPYPTPKRHLTPWTHANLTADFIGDHPATSGRRARR